MTRARKWSQLFANGTRSHLPRPRQWAFNHSEFHGTNVPSAVVTRFAAHVAPSTRASHGQRRTKTSFVKHGVKSIVSCDYRISRRRSLRPRKHGTGIILLDWFGTEAREGGSAGEGGPLLMAPDLRVPGGRGDADDLCKPDTRVTFPPPIVSSYRCNASTFVPTHQPARKMLLCQRSSNDRSFHTGTVGQRRENEARKTKITCQSESIGCSRAPGSTNRLPAPLSACLWVQHDCRTPHMDSLGMQSILPERMMRGPSWIWGKRPSLARLAAADSSGPLRGACEQQGVAAANSEASAGRGTCDEAMSISDG